MIFIILIAFLLFCFNFHFIERYFDQKPSKCTWMLATLFPINYFPISISKIIDNYLSEIIIAALESKIEIFFPQEWIITLKSLNYWLIFGLLCLCIATYKHFRTIWSTDGIYHTYRSALIGICCNFVCLAFADYIKDDCYFFIAFLSLYLVSQHFYSFRNLIYQYKISSSLYLLVAITNLIVVVLLLFGLKFHISELMIDLFFFLFKLLMLVVTVVYFIMFFISNIDHIFDCSLWFQSYKITTKFDIGEVLAKISVPYGYIAIYTIAFFSILDFFNSCYLKYWLFNEVLYFIAIFQFFWMHQKLKIEEIEYFSQI
ncbi:unnamed protein product [Blepharisma stoltei]|uniref:Uncharacterized protein n=1 Tax=Blepharisma stoltei TaxID=1481888 RepID=A0AAU9IFF2_9CILI|nr:unnamed protein product [Blepharisma stoltei]